MAKDLEYFKDFHKNPSSYRVKEFYEFVHEWIDYMKAHEGEFNYLEDEEWREIKDRVLDALEYNEDLRDEFEDLQERLEWTHENGTDHEKIEVRKEWLEFMKQRQWNYNFSAEEIADQERALYKYILSVYDCDAAHERLKRSQLELEKSIQNLDEGLTQHFLRTGHRLVLTSLALKYGKRLKGN